MSLCSRPPPQSFARNRPHEIVTLLLGCCSILLPCLPIWSLKQLYHTRLAFRGKFMVRSVKILKLVLMLAAKCIAKLGFGWAITFMDTMSTDHIILTKKE